MPFLDHRVVEVGLGLPDSAKLRRLETKRALREIVAKRLMRRSRACEVGSAYVDHPPKPGTWTYRVGLRANWRNDPEFGDVLLLSPPGPLQVAPQSRQSAKLQSRQTGAGAEAGASSRLVQNNSCICRRRSYGWFARLFATFYTGAPGFSPRRLARRPRMLGAAALTLALVALVPLGRWERDRFADRQWRGIEEVRALVGPVDSPSLDACRTSTLTCFLYRRGADPYALALCWDVRGQLVETTDRRRGEARLRRWSIAWDPALSRSTEPVDVLRRLTERPERS